MFFFILLKINVRICFYLKISNTIFIYLLLVPLLPWGSKFQKNFIFPFEFYVKVNISSDKTLY